MKKKRILLPKPGRKVRVVLNFILVLLLLLRLDMLIGHFQPTAVYSFRIMENRALLEHSRIVYRSERVILGVAEHYVLQGTCSRQNLGFHVSGWPWTCWISGVLGREAPGLALLQETEQYMDLAAAGIPAETARVEVRFFHAEGPALEYAGASGEALDEGVFVVRCTPADPQEAESAEGADGYLRWYELSYDLRAYGADGELLLEDTMSILPYSPV